jgi:hypothetical protein
MKFEIELTRHNVTPAQFLAYVRHVVDKRGGDLLRSDLDLGYFKAGNDLNFDIKHDGTREKSVSKPYEMQTFIRNTNGGTYNEICEFEFDDENTGHGYYYLINETPDEDLAKAVEAPETTDSTPESESPAEAEETPYELGNIILGIRSALEASPARSAWNRGVKEYAYELFNSLTEALEGGYFAPDDLAAPKLVARALLNGADDWSHYSWGGSALIYDEDIARRLCSPSELKRTRDGERRPNACEEWLDTQARALFQASALLCRIIHEEVTQ